MNFENIPKYSVKEVYYISILCEHYPSKIDSDHACITICGTNIKWNGDVGTKTASLEIFKFMINSVLLCKGAQFSEFDIGNFYFDTLMKKLECVKIHLYKIHQEFVD